MALMCDYRIASAAARFSEGYIRIGLVPGDGGCFYLPRLIGRPRALRLLWTGEFIAAEQALGWNLVDEVCAADEFDTRLDAFATQIARQPPVAVQMIKNAVRQSDTGDLRSALDLIASHQAVAMTTSDSIEALDAYTTRRTPTFEADDKPGHDDYTRTNAACGGARIVRRVGLRTPMRCLGRRRRPRVQPGTRAARTPRADLAEGPWRRRGIEPLPPCGHRGTAPGRRPVPTTGRANGRSARP